jgi:hypothetical protein
MKKLLVGLLVIFVLAGLAAVGAGYYVYRQIRSTVSQFAELGQVPGIERGIRLKGSYAPPASGELTAGQVERFMRVQAGVRQKLGERMKEFERKYKALSEKDEPSLSDAPAVIAAYRDLASTWLDAKRSQVAALNDAGLSLDEYQWIRDQAYRALGIPYVDLDLRKLTEDVQGSAASQVSRLRGALEASGPELNRELIAGFKKQLEDNVALASFGL